jgi:hypothetical protein
MSSPVFIIGNYKNMEPTKIILYGKPEVIK